MRYDKQEVLSRLDFAELYADTFPGFRQINDAQALARCAFHSPDKNPSMSLNLEKGLFHCFSCGASGGPIDLMMQAWGVDFKTCLDRLAERAGLI